MSWFHRFRAAVVGSTLFLAANFVVAMLVTGLVWITNTIGIWMFVAMMDDKASRPFSLNGFLALTGVMLACWPAILVWRNFWKETN